VDPHHWFDVLEYLVGGMTNAEILRESPYRTEEDIRWRTQAGNFERAKRLFDENLSTRLPGVLVMCIQGPPMEVGTSPKILHKYEAPDVKPAGESSMRIDEASEDVCLDLLGLVATRCGRLRFVIPTSYQAAHPAEQPSPTVW
jgi:hypothetical protein